MRLLVRSNVLLISFAAPSVILTVSCMSTHNATFLCETYLKRSTSANFTVVLDEVRKDRLPKFRAEQTDVTVATVLRDEPRWISHIASDSIEISMVELVRLRESLGTRFQGWRIFVSGRKKSSAVDSALTITVHFDRGPSRAQKVPVTHRDVPVRYSDLHLLKESDFGNPAPDNRGMTYYSFSAVPKKAQLMLRGYQYLQANLIGGTIVKISFASRSAVILDSKEQTLQFFPLAVVGIESVSAEGFEGIRARLRSGHEARVLKSHSRWLGSKSNN